MSEEKNVAEKIGSFIGTFIGEFLKYMIGGCLLWWVWNHNISGWMTLPVIEYWQSVCIWILCDTMFHRK